MTDLPVVPLNVKQEVSDIKDNIQIFKKAKKTKTKVKCDLCEAVLESSTTFKEHRRIHTGEKPHSCEHCGKCFRQSGSLRIHRRIHTGKPFQCDVCGNAFAEKAALRNHRRIHTGERPYKCDECDKAFRISSLLKIHKKIHSGIADYICDICSKAFFNTTSLTKHRRIHWKPYECLECGKCYSLKVVLERHKKLHRGEKDYSCEQCGKKFADSGNLKSHIRIHTGEKPYICHICSKGFTKSSNLNVHLVVHSGETPFKCPVCDHGMRELVQLKKHMMKKHGIEYRRPTTPNPPTLAPEPAPSPVILAPQASQISEVSNQSSPGPSPDKCTSTYLQTSPLSTVPGAEELISSSSQGDVHAHNTSVGQDLECSSEISSVNKISSEDNPMDFCQALLIEPEDEKPVHVKLETFDTDDSDFKVDINESDCTPKKCCESKDISGDYDLSNVKIEGSNNSDENIIYQ